MIICKLLCVSDFVIAVVAMLFMMTVYILHDFLYTKVILYDKSMNININGTYTLYIIKFVSISYLRRTNSVCN